MSASRPRVPTGLLERSAKAKLQKIIDFAKKKKKKRQKSILFLLFGWYLDEWNFFITFAENF